MKIFWLRFMTFFSLWIWVIVQATPPKSLSIFVFSAVLALYFFLSMKKNSFLILFVMTVLVFIYGLLIEQASIHAIILLLYILLEAVFQLNTKENNSLILVISLFSVVLLIMSQGDIVEQLLFVAFYCFLVYKLNHMTMERSGQRELYDQLLVEYRKLKRMQLAATQDARLEERTKIARDIHDSVGHKLTAMMMKLEMLAIESGDSKFRELKEMAQDSLDETRTAVKALQVEENEGIASVVHLIRKLESESHIVVHFTMKQGVLSVSLTNEKSVVLYRVIQEALTNAMRHAQAREIHVILGRAANGDLSFVIKNAVFEAKPFVLGFGLTTMKQRVEHIAGMVTIQQSDHEFQIIGTLPIT
ncbi:MULTISPECIES: sensor histidine kinase [unclassified Virgibacillus]|uniref:sensor histidine kinase n=1 Tax=unclassified Virgibacillus TaxID=2620237 RepID=UPI0024DEB043|nr:sensor histidine kinase [Virgibacillus sp. LDC-1]